MGSSSKKTTTAQATSGTSTTTPNAPSWATNALQNYTGSVESFGASDPSQYVAPLTALQQQAESGSSNLGSTWQPGLAQAANDAQSTYNSAAPQIGSTAQASATGYSPTGYSATGYNPTSVGSTGYNAATTRATGYDPTASTAAQISTDDIQRLESPYTNDVVNTTLANYDQQAGQSMAALKAAAAANNAFGGSRYGVEEGEQSAQNSLNRAQTEAQLRQAEYAQALAGATTDAGFQQQTGLANQAASNAAREFGASAQNTASLSNQAARNAASQFSASAANTAGLSNQAAANTASQFGANATNAANDFNASAANTAGAFGASAANNASQFNAGALNSTATQNANLQNDSLARQLTAAGLLGSLSGQADQLGTNDINTQAAQGAVQQANDASYRTAGLSQLQALAQLLQQGQFGLLTGQTTNSNQQENGTQVQTSNPGLLGSLSTGLATGSKLASLFG